MKLRRSFFPDWQRVGKLTCSWGSRLLLLLLLKLFIVRPILYEPERSGITESINIGYKIILKTKAYERHKMNAKTMRIQTMLKTVFGDSRIDMLGREFQMEGPATENALSPNLVLAEMLNIFRTS